MKFLHKLLMCGLFLTTFIFCKNSVFGEKLPFQVGDTASYTIFQKNFNSRVGGIDPPTRWKSKMAFDIKILSLNPETGSYPIEVEINVKKLHYAQLVKVARGGASRNGASAMESAPLHENISQYPNAISEINPFEILTSQPMVFRIDGEFQVQEMTEVLEEFAKTVDRFDPIVQDICGTSLWSFTLILTQMFHLAGQDIPFYLSYDASHLLPTHVPTSCLQLINRNRKDDSFSEENSTIEECSHYSVQKVDAIDVDYWTAAWNGTAHVQKNVLAGVYNGNVSVQGKVAWQPNQPLRQERKFRAIIKEIYPPAFCGRAKAKYKISQKWAASPPPATAAEES